MKRQSTSLENVLVQEKTPLPELLHEFKWHYPAWLNTEDERYVLSLQTIQDYKNPLRIIFSVANKVNQKNLIVNSELEEEVGKEQEQELAIVKTTQQFSPKNCYIEVRLKLNLVDRNEE